MQRACQSNDLGIQDGLRALKANFAQPGMVNETLTHDRSTNLSRAWTTHPKDVLGTNALLLPELRR